jgi:transposase
MKQGKTTLSHNDEGKKAKRRLLLLSVYTGSPWRDLPAEFGRWNSVFKRFRRWVRRGAFERIFQILSVDADLEYVMVDGTIVRVHRHGQGAKGGRKTSRSAKAVAD